jgi:hypothetical protein
MSEILKGRDYLITVRQFAIDSVISAEISECSVYQSSIIITWEKTDSLQWFKALMHFPGKFLSE